MHRDVCPTLPNRWEGVADEDAAYLDALGSKARKQNKKVKVNNVSGIKPKEK